MNKFIKSNYHINNFSDLKGIKEIVKKKDEEINEIAKKMEKKSE